MKSFYNGLQHDILILEFFNLFTQVKSSEERWCNVAGKIAGGGRQNRSCVLNLRRSQVKNKEKIGFVLFFLSLHHPKTRFDNVSILCLPLFKSAAKKTIPRYKKILKG
jgi:hypothetical protein